MTADFVYGVSYAIELIAIALFIASIAQNSRTGFSPIGYWIRRHARKLCIGAIIIFLFCRLDLKAEAAWIWILIAFIISCTARSDVEAECRNLRLYVELADSMADGSATETQTAMFARVSAAIRKRQTNL